MTGSTPSSQQLDYLLGKLPEAERAALERRLHSDPELAKQLDALEIPDDSFVRWLKQSMPAAAYPNDPYLKQAIDHLHQLVPPSVPSLKPGSTDQTLPPQPLAPQAPVDTLNGQGVDDTSRDANRVALPQRDLERLGRYRIARVLGKGGMGAVYLAHDEELDRQVALKIPLIDQHSSPEVVERFKREARSAAALHHRNICPVFDVGEIEGQPYLTMAFVEGETLSSWVRNRRPTSEVLGVVIKIARALGQAHELGVIHRDLKPANVMMDRHDEPVIMDFGLARRQSTAGDNLTQTGQIMGTPAYMPPEQVAGRSADMGPPCDIYALGVILYELLTGHRPFQSDDLFSLISQIALEPPTRLRQHNSEIDPDLEAICLKALEKRQGDRWSTMNEFAEALESFLLTGPAIREALDTPRQSQSLRPSESEAKPATGGGARWIWGGGALIVLLLLAAGVWQWAGVLFKIETPDGTLILNISEDNAEVRIVDAQSGSVEIHQSSGEKISISIAPGSKRLEVEKQGFKIYTSEFQIGSGKELILSARLEPKINAPAPPEPEPMQNPSGIAFYRPDFQKWRDEVSGLPAHKLAEAVVAKLDELNPDAGTAFVTEVEFGKVLEVMFTTEKVNDISPLCVLKDLSELRIFGPPLNGKITDIEPLRGLKLELLVLSNNPVSDLSPLTGMPLRTLCINGTRVKDLTPLKGMPLNNLQLHESPISDLSPLRGMKLTILEAAKTQVQDLSPLAGLPLTKLDLDMTRVSDISPLKGMPLTYLRFMRTGVSDLSPLEGMQLKTLNIEQIRARDLSPLKGMPITNLSCGKLPTQDYSALAGLPVEHLGIPELKTSDFSPFFEMPLKSVYAPGVRGLDPEVLRGKPLRDVTFVFDPTLHTEVLKSIPTLEMINAKPAAEFWQAQEADGETSSQ